MISDFLANALLNHVLRNHAANYVPPANVYLALANGPINKQDTSLTNEVSGGSYGRKEITFDAAAAGLSRSNAVVTFATPTADWGAVGWIALMDTGCTANGNILFYGPICTKRINNGDPAPQFANRAVKAMLGCC